MDEPDNTTEENEAKEREFVVSGIAELENRLTLKQELRQKLAEACKKRPEESFFSKLDSNIKKNTAFVRKIKNFTEAQKDGILKDLTVLNLTKYVSEVAAGFVEAKLKMSDVQSAVQVCAAIHEKYADFAPQLLEAWQKTLSLKKDEKIANASKLRVDLRFYAELISAGVFSPKEGLPLLGGILTNLVNGDKEEHNNASIILAFCKFCGEDYAGLAQQKLRIGADKFGMKVPRSTWLPPEKQQNVRNLLRDYYSSLSKHLVDEHTELQSFERQNRRILQTKGELSSERKERHENLLQNYSKLLTTTQQFAETLDEPLPELPVDQFPKEEEGMVLQNTESSAAEMRENLTELLWENEEERLFYQSFPNLNIYLPNLAFKNPGLPTASEEQVVEPEKDEIKEDEEDKDIKEVMEEDVKPVDLEDDKEEESASNLPSNKIVFDSFLSSLPTCVNREMIDSAAIEFCNNLNTRLHRRKLVRAMFMVPRTRLDLLPFYARLAAVLNPFLPDVATDLCGLLKQDFRYHVRKKDQINIETKVKVVRFIGELTKFGLFPRADALMCLKLLLFDFTHHHIEMTCNLVETCGKYLLHHPDSHQRTKVYLEQMQRKKAMMASDSRYITMIENAYYHVLPVDSSVRTTTKKVRTPLQEYIRYLLFSELGNKGATKRVLKQLRKLDWNDKETSVYAVRCLTAAWKVRFLNIRTLAGVVAELSLYQEFVGHVVVDAVLEDIRWGMEFPLAKYNQRRTAMVKYLGELYNYRMIESTVVFKVLYSLITFGVSYDPAVVSEFDPPDNLIRLRLVYTLLDTCGVFFCSGTSRKRLDCYLVYLQHYYWFKKTLTVWNEENPFPVEMDFDLEDTLRNLRPKLKHCKSYEEAGKAVENLENEMLQKLNQAAPQLNLETGGSSEDALGAIVEADEAEEIDDPADESKMEVDDEDERSLSRSQMSQNTTRDDTTQPDEDMRNLDNVVVTAPKRDACPEDDDFMAALDRMVAENIHERSREMTKPPNVDISIPWQIKTALKKGPDGVEKPSLGGSLGGELGSALAAAESSSSTAIATPVAATPATNPDTVSFVMMMRKGNKAQFKSLAVPSDSDIAQNLRNREQAEKAEKERVKKLTLDFTERQEEEEFQEQFASVNRPPVHNLNRERRGRFQHLKGAPDADSIFGGRKNR
nr:EOG090X0143 [Eulimnadia texana]